MSNTAAHLHQSGYRPTKHDNEMADLFPKTKPKYINTSLFNKNKQTIVINTHLNSLVRAQVKVKLGRMCNSNVYGRAGRNVPRFTRLLLLIGTKQTCVMAFLHHDESYPWFAVIQNVFINFVISYYPKLNHLV